MAVWSMARQGGNDVQEEEDTGDLCVALAEKIKKLCMVAVGRCCILEELRTVGEFLSIEGSVEGEDGNKIGPIKFLVDTGSEVFCLTESIFVRCKKELAGSRKIQGAHSQETKDIYNIVVFVDGEKDRVLAVQDNYNAISKSFYLNYSHVIDKDAGLDYWLK